MASGFYDHDSLSAFEAISQAQKIAFAPMLFQAALSLRDLGVLEFLDGRKEEGATLREISDHTGLDGYAAGVLVDMGLSANIIYLSEGTYRLSKIGFFILHDRMTAVNMNFTADVCYQGMASLTDSLKNGRPEGLRVFGSWPSIYPHLRDLPPRARQSWFAFDHFYSDACFKSALPHVFRLGPSLIYDLGGNTGRFAVSCCAHDSKVRVTILDLGGQIEMARENIKEQGLEGRVDFHAVDILDSGAELPVDADVWWMSQFLDCFSEEQVIGILRAVRRAMHDDARVCIMEPFWDYQKFEAISYSLNASSLYFTAMANGRSRFFSRDTFLGYLDRAGLSPEDQIENLGVCHTLLVCVKK